MQGLDQKQPLISEFICTIVDSHEHEHRDLKILQSVSNSIKFLVHSSQTCSDTIWNSQISSYSQSIHNLKSKSCILLSRIKKLTFHSTLKTEYYTIEFYLKSNYT